MTLTRLPHTLARTCEGERTISKRAADLTSDVRPVAVRKSIIRDGERPGFVHLIVEGWAATHGIQTLTDCRVAYMRSAKVDRLTSDHNGLTKALWMATLVDEPVLRSWIVNNGRRDAFSRIAHLLCELHYRMEMVGLVDLGRFGLPLTQVEIGDAVGLTSVHTNRVLQRLRKQKLIELSGGMLTVLDVNGLRQAAGYDSSYLHIKRRQSA